MPEGFPNWKKHTDLEQVPTGEPAKDPFEDFDGEVPPLIKKDIDEKIRRRIEDEDGGIGDPPKPGRAD